MFGSLTLSLAATAFALAAAGPYALAAGETLEVQVDQKDPVTVTFEPADFAAIGAATALEVCAVINRTFAQDQIPGSAVVYNGAVKILSNDDGQVLIPGGTAAEAFTFTSGSTANLEGGDQPSAPTFTTLVSFTGDASYPTGGTSGFLALYQAATKSGRQVLAVVPQDCGGYGVSYNPLTDKLKVTQTGAINSPAAEVPNTTNLGAVTFNVVVTAK